MDYDFEKLSASDAYDILNEYVGITQETLDAIFGINGFTVETAQDILYWFTGWNDFKGYLEETGYIE